MQIIDGDEQNIQGQIQQMIRDGRIGVYTLLEYYMLCPDRSSCVELMDRMRRHRMDVIEPGPDLLEEDLATWGRGLSEQQQMCTLRWGLIGWRLDQNPFLVDMLVRDLRVHWLEPIGARLLGCGIGSAPPEQRVLMPGRQFADSSRSDLTWEAAITRLRYTQLPCEYFVNGLVSLPQVHQFINELKQKLRDEREQDLLARFPLWQMYTIDRRLMPEPDELGTDPQPEHFAPAAEQERSQGVHLAGSYTAQEHRLLCTMLMDTAAEMEARFEGSIRPHGDLYRQHHIA